MKEFVQQKLLNYLAKLLKATQLLSVTYVYGRQGRGLEREERLMQTLEHSQLMLMGKLALYVRAHQVHMQGTLNAHTRVIRGTCKAHSAHMQRSCAWHVLM